MRFQCFPLIRARHTDAEYSRAFGFVFASSHRRSIDFVHEQRRDTDATCDFTEKPSRDN